MTLFIDFKNGEAVALGEESLDCSKLTIIGHAGALIRAWVTKKSGVYEIDSYNAVLLDEVVSIWIKT